MARRKQAQEGSPTVAARLLANELRQLRLSAGLSRAEVAGELGCTTGRVGHIETRRNQPRRADLLVMMQMYKVPPEKQVWYLDMYERAKKKGWWDGAEGIPEWFSALVGLEWGASEIQTLEIGIVPGLLQTSAYMESLFRSASGQSEQLVQSYLEHRLLRQRGITREEQPLRLHALLDEAPLRRVVGGPAVMREQLHHLAEMNERQNVTIRVLPFNRGAYSGLQSSFHMLRFAAPSDPGVVYLETQLGGLYLEEENEIAMYASSFEQLTAIALTVEQSNSMIRKIAKEF